MKASAKYLYSFGDGRAEGSASMRNLLGGKGSNLAEMANLGMPVPAGFTLTTEVCTQFYSNGGRYPAGLESQLGLSMRGVEKMMNKGFGSPRNPLLVSVRSGARISMPGMMDTVLNLGLNDQTVEGLIRVTGNERFAFDAYRRFVQMYSNVVLGLPMEKFEGFLESLKKKRGIKEDSKLSAKDLRGLVEKYKNLVKKLSGKEFPKDPKDQLWGAIGAVFRSWMIPRAITYRRLNKIPEDWGTAVNVQAMVFGNMGEDSGTGVAFTRNPSTGEKIFFGEYLINAQGEDVVAGIRTPRPVTPAKVGGPSLKKDMPLIFEKLTRIYKKLEKHYRDMQDIEFTIEKGKLWMLQTRSGKRTAAAAVCIAVDMVAEGMINKKEAVLRVDPEALDQLLHPMVDPKAKVKVIAKGLPASPGAGIGQAVFSSEAAEDAVKNGKKVILVRSETSPEDIAGMAVAEAILTARGGMTSHAAVVARGMGKTCVAGCGDIMVDSKRKYFITKNGVKIKAGDWITIEGSSGRVIQGTVRTIAPKVDQKFTKLMSWADDFRKLKVRTNADTPGDCKVARKFGAEGIGLCRTEHMFFGDARIPWIRQMILAIDEPSRRRALKKLLPMQKRDFIGIFKAMAGLPVTIRLLDPPLHEFLPQDSSEIRRLAKSMKMSPRALEQRIEGLHETNPMLGHRGCRLGISYPEIYEMQAQAIFEAACTVTVHGVRCLPEVMIPLVADRSELAFCRNLVKRVAAKVLKSKGMKIKFTIGTMIELPRAALMAGEIAKEADFFSFGTNDLTQTTFGFSRDDAGKFLPEYVERKFLPADPFQTLDVEGVGRLIYMGVESGRQSKPGLKVGICGEHGGDPASVLFCHQAELDYVSCSPYRVPVARLAAAHAALGSS